MRAAYSFLDGTHESPSEAAKEYCCQRQHVHYYVRKLVSQSVSRSDTASSGRTSTSGGDNEASRTSSDLWDLPGGATGDECYSIVKAKTVAKQAKVAATMQRLSVLKESNRRGLRAWCWGRR